MANQHSKSSRRQLILAFVREFPNLPSREIGAAFDISSRHIGSELDQLARWGYLHGVREGRCMYWTVTGKQPLQRERGEVPKQTTLSAWVPHHQRDALISAFFGPAQSRSEPA